MSKRANDKEKKPFHIQTHIVEFPFSLISDLSLLDKQTMFRMQIISQPT